MTTQTTISESMTRQAEVIEASQVEGRSGETQWSLKLLVKDISQFPVPCFMGLDRAAQVLKGSTHLVTMRRGRLKQGKEGRFPSEYFWDLTGWDVQAPTPVPSQSHQEHTDGAPAPWDAADTQSRISWAQAVNLGVAALGPLPQNARLSAEEEYGVSVERLANRFYPLIRKGPTPQAEPLAEEEWEEHVEPDGHGGADVVQEPVGRPHKPFPIRGEKEAAVAYYLRVAQETYGKGQKEALAAIGGVWGTWVTNHPGGEHQEAAVQAAILALAEE